MPQPKPPYCVWNGRLGQRYIYFVFPLDAGFAEAEPGNYAFSQEVEGAHKALFFGETTNLKDSLAPGAGIWDEALKLGATHIHAHLNPDGDEARRAERTELIAAYKPPLNEEK